MRFDPVPEHVATLTEMNRILFLVLLRLRDVVLLLASARPGDAFVLPLARFAFAMPNCVDMRASRRKQGHPATKLGANVSTAKLLPAGTQMWSFASAMSTAQGTKPRDLPRLYDRPSKCFLALPHDALSSTTLRYYAFAVTEDFLADLARSAPKRERLRVPHADGVQLTHHGLRLVRFRTGAHRIFLTAGRIDRDRPPRHPPPFVAPNGIVPLVAVCSTEPSSYRKRPSQEQVDRLTDLFGTPPQWWTAFSRDMPRQPTDEVIASARA